MIVWQAKLDQEEEVHVDDELLGEMCDRLDKFWRELRDELLYA